MADGKRGQILPRRRSAQGDTGKQEPTREGAPQWQPLARTGKIVGTKEGNPEKGF